MMAENILIPANQQRKVDSLKQMTVANGATASEAESAAQMIAHIYSKFGLSYEKQSSVIGNKTAQSSTTFINQEAEFYKAVANGSLESKIQDFDWDALAKTILSVPNYFEYVNNTTKDWEQRTTRKFSVAISLENARGISEEEYKRRCFREFMKIYLCEKENSQCFSMSDEFLYK